MDAAGGEENLTTKQSALLVVASLIFARAAQAQSAWSFSASAYAYFIPDVPYLQPTLTADRARLHLEARYNYEDQETGSLWVGANFSGGGKVTWGITPIIGAVIGNTSGIAAGYRGAVSWWKLDLASESEYVFDLSDQAASFLYNWSELAYSPWEWLRLGVVTQRTRAYQSDRELQRGFLAGGSYKRWTGTAYLFNPDDPDPTVVLAAAVEF